jgi:DnaK suppressor protein
MTPDDAKLAARLATQRTAVAHRIETMTAELAAVAAAAAGSNVDDEHDPEGATIAFEREQLAGLRAQAREQLRELDAALERVRAGNYGRCEQCGQPIGQARLTALPAARLCVTCASTRRG